MGRRFRRRHIVAVSAVTVTAALKLEVPVGSSIPEEELQLSPLVVVTMTTLIRVTEWGTS